MNDQPDLSVCVTARVHYSADTGLSHWPWASADQRSIGWRTTSIYGDPDGYDYLHIDNAGVITRHIGTTGDWERDDQAS